MKLLIVSHTPHFIDQSGGIVGWGPTVQEIDQLSQLFSRIVHVAPLYRGEAPESALSYSSGRVVFQGVKPSGGDRWADKIGIILKIPHYMRAILEGLGNADLVHVRCPANISLIALGMLLFVRNPLYRWIKYAGDWSPKYPTPLSYRIQRWLLRKDIRNWMVTVNGSGSAIPSHVRSILNPSEIAKGSWRTNSEKTLAEPIQLLFVGALTHSKGAVRAVKIAADLKAQQIAFQLHILGDGEAKAACQRESDALGISPYLNFTGWLPREAIIPYYERAHFILLPSVSEGWPKVLSEAMQFGVVPIASAVSMIPEVLARIGAGRVVEGTETDQYTRALIEYLHDPMKWLEESQAGILSASLFSYEAYLNTLNRYFVDRWGLDLRKEAAADA